MTERVGRRMAKGTGLTWQGIFRQDPIANYQGYGKQQGPSRRLESPVPLRCGVVL